MVRLSNGFGRDDALGNTHNTSLMTLVEEWDAEPLRRMAADLHSAVEPDRDQVQQLARAAHAACDPDPGDGGT